MRLDDFDAVIFDMDGLLLDTETVSMRTFLETCDAFGVAVDVPTYKQSIGTTAEDTRKMFAPLIGGDEAYRAFRKVWSARYYADAVEKPVPVKPGVFAILKWLASTGIPIALATSTSSSIAPTKLAHANLTAFFPIVVTGDLVENGKPAPDIFLLAAEKLGIDPSKCLVFEDSDNGVRAAIGAGMSAIQVPDLVQPSDEVRGLGHRVVPSLFAAQMLLKGLAPSDVSIRPLQLDDAAQVLELIELCFPEMAAEDQYDEEELEEISRVFPEGCPVVTYQGKPIGFALGIFVDLDFDNMPIDEETLLGDYSCRNHDADGDYYWGSDIGVHPEWRGLGIGRKIYDYRKALVQRHNRKGFAAAGVLPGYANHRDLDIHTYVDRVIAGDLKDPTLSTQLRNGFIVKRLLKDYYNFPPSDNWSTLLFWANPEHRMDRG